MEEEKVTLNIPVFEILLVIGIVVFAIGIAMMAGIYKFEFLGLSIWLDTDLAIIFLPIGIGLICGYITRKMLKRNGNGFLIGLLLGLIGLGIAIYINSKEKLNTNANENKYEELQKLSELKQKGILTEEEFNKEKEKILK